MTFSATDAPLSGKDLDESGLAQFPMVIGGIVPVVNVEGLQPSDLVLDGATLAKIFLGEVKTWNDPAIAKLNANVKLPNQAIAIVHRPDGSGTTYNFTYYLSEVSPDWKTNVGTNTAVEWPGGLGAKGNEGVANNVAQTEGSIGYLEYAYAKQNKLVHAKVVNKDGKVVAPSSETFQAGRQRRLELQARLRRHPGQPTSPALHPGRRPLGSCSTRSRRTRRRPPKPSSSSPGPTPKATRWPTNSIVPMPDKVVGDIEKMWSTEIKDAAGTSPYVASK